MYLCVHQEFALVRTSFSEKYDLIQKFRGGLMAKNKNSCVKLKNKTSKCSWKSLGSVNDLEALAHSSNYYQFLIAIGLTGRKYSYNMALDNLDYAFNTYRNMLSSYGLGVKTGQTLNAVMHNKQGLIHF